MRAADLQTFLLILAVMAGCADGQSRDGTGTAGTGTSTGAAGAATTTGAAGTGSVSSGAAGGSTSGAAGTGSGTGAAGTGTSTGAAGAPAGTDNGQLFRDAAVVTPGQEPPPPTDGGARTDASLPPASMGTLHINSIGLNAVFTQKGTDVTMVLTATNCPMGMHVLQIHGGFSCDNASTQGGVWDGKRGDGIPAFTCDATKKGSLTYTRSGADPATNWTVGDHSTKTDVTLHPSMVEGNCGTFF